MKLIFLLFDLFNLPVNEKFLFIVRKEERRVREMKFINIYICVLIFTKKKEKQNNVHLLENFLCLTGE